MKKSALTKQKFLDEFEHVYQESSHRSIWFDIDKKNYIIINEIESPLTIAQLNSIALSENVFVNIHNGDKVFRISSNETEFPINKFAEPYHLGIPGKPDYRSTKSRKYGWIYCPTSCNKNEQYFVVTEKGGPQKLADVLKELRAMGFSFRKNKLPKLLQEFF